MSDSRVATTSERDVAPSGVAALNDLAPAAAREALRRCCGSEPWVTRMERGRPYASAEALRRQADAVFDALSREDWLQAFAAHARIGSPRAGDEQGASEQSEASSASAAERAALQEGNERYEARFGHVFLIRACGLDAGKLLAALRDRLEHPPELELEIAAGQQREITRLRLDALLGP